MSRILRGLLCGLLALLGVSVMAPATQAAPISATSASGNLRMDVLNSYYVGAASTFVPIAIMQEGQNGFRLVGLDGAPLVPLGQDLFVELFVEALNNTLIPGWTLALVGGGSAGETIQDGGITTGLGGTTVGANGSATLRFAPQMSLYIEKDLNATLGEITAVIQALAIPAPASLLIFAAGLAGLVVVRRRATH